MRRLILFLAFAGTGFACLVWFAGGMGSSYKSSQNRTVIETRKRGAQDEHVIEAGEGIPDIRQVEGISQLAPPRAAIWKDRLSEETIDIPRFIPWRFHAADAIPMKRRDKGKQAVRCSGVIFRTNREPVTRAEALALVRSERDAYKPLLHQEFRSDQARVYGPLADRLQRRNTPVRSTEQTQIQLDGNVQIDDKLQGTTIKGKSVLVWPDEERAEGFGRFTVEHEAFVLVGNRMSMERVKEKGWSRLSILNNPVLDIVSDVKDRDGNLVFDFGPGGFRPAHITSEGRAILVREERRRETVITVTFSDNVHAEQEGGRSLKADRIKLVAVKEKLPMREGRGGWKLQYFEAQGDVHVDYRDQTAKGRTYIASFTADRMTHEVPRVGAPVTTLDGDPVIHIRGEFAVLGPGDRLRALCRDRAWIGAVPAGLPTSGLPQEALQHIGLRGQARIVRTALEGLQSEEDVLEGDEIDLVLWKRGAEEGAPTEPDAGDKMIATYFAALGNVRLDGTRIRGTCHRLVGENLHKATPHIFADGRAKHFVFPDIGGEQRLLGPEPAAQPEPKPSAPVVAQPPRTAQGGSGTDPERSEDEGAGSWQLNTMRAVGSVDIDTSMGGPAVGIPTNIVGDEATYDRVSSRAQVKGAPARISWIAFDTTMNVIETPTMTLDRAQGMVTAEGGVRGEIYMMRGSGGDTGSFVMPGTSGAQGDAAGAELSIRTDARIDIALAGMGPSFKPRPGSETRIQIGGPVTAELRNANHAVDRLKAESLEVGLLYLMDLADAEDDPAASSAPSSSAGGGTGSTGTRPARRPRRTTGGGEEAAPERFEIAAAEMRAQLNGGDVHTLDATGNVDMRGESGHITGDRMHYNAERRHARVFASDPDWRTRPAVAILGDTEQRTEVRGEQLAVYWVDGKITTVEAFGPKNENEHATIRMYSRDAKRPGRLEWYSLVYTGSVNMTSELLRAGRVRLMRRIRETPQEPWGPPTALWSPTLRVIGRNMLSTDEKLRDMQRILAEGPGTTFQSGEGADLIKAWGHLFDYDVATKKATLTGLKGADVTIRKGGTLHVDQSKLKIDMNTNMPTYMQNGRIFWRPPPQKPPPARPK